jgi:hypothetical protein
MTASGPKSLPAIGFLTVVEHPPHGLFGGYLVVNATGRPLEFHCTAPVKPNRAQEILYGPTLRPYLFGEQIGFTLFSKAKVKPLWICTDCEPVVALRDLIEVPVALVAEATKTLDFDSQAAGSACASESADLLDGGLRSRERNTDLTKFEFGKYEVWLPRQHDTDARAVLDQWRTHAETLDVIEPFERIRDAIEEAQRVAA